MLRDFWRERAQWILPIWNTDRRTKICVAEAEATVVDTIQIRVETVADALFATFVQRLCVWTSAAVVVKDV